MSGISQPVAMKFAKGSYIVVEGKPSADRFYIIKEGQVQITREADSIISAETVAGSGEMFGVVSAMASRSYIETAVAITDVILLIADRSHIIKSTPIAVNIIKQLSQRLRKLDETYSHRLLKSAAVNDPSHLLQIGAYYESVRKSDQALYAYRQYLVYRPNAENSNIINEKIKKLKPHSKVVRPVYTPDTMVQKYPKNCLLFAEGETGHNLYIIQEGSIKITKIVNNQEVILAVLNKGDILGEMAMLEDKPRAATAEVYEDCTLLSVNRANFASLINDQPDMVIRLTTLMAERIWLLYRQLTNTLIESPTGRIYDALLIQLEKNRVDLSSGNPYMCNFGFKELVSMAGYPEIKASELYRKISTEKMITENQEKVFVKNVANVMKEAAFYRKSRKAN
jgi:CRP-like cAMP-binding protein